MAFRTVRYSQQNQPKSIEKLEYSASTRFSSIRNFIRCKTVVHALGETDLPLLSSALAGRSLFELPILFDGGII